MATVPTSQNTIRYFQPSCNDLSTGFKAALGSPSTIIKGGALLGSIRPWMHDILKAEVPPKLIPVLKGAAKAGSGLLPMFFLRQTFVLGNELYSNSFNIKSRKVVDATAEWIRDASNLSMLVLKNVYFGLSAACCDIIHETISFCNASLDLERSHQTINSLQSKGLNPDRVKAQLEASKFLVMAKAVSAIAGAVLKIFTVVYGTQYLLAALTLSAASKIFAILGVFHKEMSDETIYKRALVTKFDQCPSILALA